jgi:hypothetical protein
MSELFNFSRLPSLAEAIVKQATVVPPPPPAEPGLAKPATGSWNDIFANSVEFPPLPNVTYERGASSTD